jgi:hypothetical protein
MAAAHLAHFTAMMECLSSKLYVRLPLQVDIFIFSGCTAEMTLYDLIHLFYKQFYACLEMALTRYESSKMQHAPASSAEYAFVII